MMLDTNGTAESLTTVGLFAGIGGIELGLHRAGHRSLMLCEFAPEARRVLEDKAEFQGARIETDVRALAGIVSPNERRRRFPSADVVAAGFPCQDLSQAGRGAGIGGQRSGLVTSLLELLSVRRRSPKWVLIENVPFMLRLDGGRAMDFLTSSLEGLGFRWAYRIVDSRAFGLPQRRQRVIMLASRRADPRDVLFVDDEPAVERVRGPKTLCGFYWTEGNRGLGWAVDAVPTLKAGSTVGIPSPPAVWFPARDHFGTPSIEAAEMLQGFPPGWTESAVDDPARRNGPRWRMVGNAVTVDVAEWVGRRLASPGAFDPGRAAEGWTGRWPIAAYGEPSGRFWSVDVGEFPMNERYQPLGGFFGNDTRPLSARAAGGFLGRFERSSLARPEGFVESLRTYVAAAE